jgi:outer membrane lipoprotein-sorting protein
MAQGCSYPQSGAVFLLLTVFFSSGGCALLAPSQPADVPPASTTLAPQLLASLDTRRQALTSLRGLARVVYSDPQEKGTAKQAIAVAAPNHFRLELFSPIGIALLTACDGNTLAAYFPQEKAMYRGAATPLNIARFIRIPLSSRDITGLLLGLPILPAQGEVGTAQGDPHTGWYQLNLTVSGYETHRLWFEQKDLLLMRWEVRANDGTVLSRVILADYRKVNGHYFPFEIVLSDIQGKQEAAIYYERVELNPPLSDSLFTLRPIPGVQEIDVDAFSGEQRVGVF